MSHLSLSRGIGDLMLTGIIYAVNRRTGAITHMSTVDYERAEKCRLLEGFLVRLGRVPAEALSAEIRVGAAKRN